jgi:hypothetical protein
MSSEFSVREAGRRGGVRSALRRWGPPAERTTRVVRIGDLTEDQRRSVHAVIAAHRAANERTVAEGQSPATVEDVRDATQRPE